MMTTHSGLLRTANMLKIARWGLISLRPKDSFIEELVANNLEVRSTAIKRALKRSNAVAIYELLDRDIVPCMYELTPLQRASVIGTAQVIYCELNQHLMRAELTYWATQLSREACSTRLSNDLSVSMLLSFISESVDPKVTPIVDDAIGYINSHTKVLELKKEDVLDVMKFSQSTM
ncbi:hypothetical protein [Vibrio alginolyticus]|uniref:hypothetical protein n=1 Tax=Vibrio alginolyticus TaxID=663 RepID=UPI0015F54C0F|nr:hypothetical protein [Vibrio alginolyticus]EJE4208611.1 hypothetical protein [Vibrio parahaemolyticus]